jgi:DNA repair protein RadC
MPSRQAFQNDLTSPNKPEMIQKIIKKTGRKKATESGIKKWAEDDRPREKLIAKGAPTLSDAELLAILIQSGSKEKSAVDVAREILDLGNQNLSVLSRLSVSDFQRIKGIGEAKSIAVAAALELGRRRQLSESMERKLITTSRHAADILMPLMSDLQHEKFAIICMTRNSKLLHVEFISSGGVAGTVVDPKIIFKIALQYLTSNLIIAHNHPSGNLNASMADKAVTKKIKAAAQLLEITLVDHIIIADNKYFSFADNGAL